ncbi:MFS transporter [Micromonospora sp. NPDC047707]|uniref:MFS transporter n=1 Tax=Micromonospora sp. NPDC047707 TaxID=3154498 RepID=UPI0034571233
MSDQERHDVLDGADARLSTLRQRQRVPAPWLVLLSGPLSFGITGPALILDSIAADIGVAITSATWIVSAYGWGIAVGTPLLAGLITRRGVPTLLAISGGLVALGALLVVTVPALSALIIGFGLQAVGAAGLTATAMSLADSPRRMGLITAALASFGAVAPLLGSVIDSVLSWQLVLAMPTVCLLAIPVVGRYTKGLRGTREAFDVRGAALLTALVTALVFVPTWPGVAAGVVAVIAALLSLHLRRRPDGFVPAAMIRAPQFVGAAGLAFAIAVTNFGNVYAVPSLLSGRLGWSSSQIGTAMLWPLLLGGTLSWFVVVAATRLRPASTTAAFIALVTVSVGVSIWSSSGPLLLVGLFLGSIAASSSQGWLALRAESAVGEGERPAAIGLFNLCYLLGAAFGPALVAAWLSSG